MVGHALALRPCHRSLGLLHPADPRKRVHSADKAAQQVRVRLWALHMKLLGAFIVISHAAA